MQFLYIIILAVVQGLTEFLPVSSSGHLVLLNKIFGIEHDFLLLSVILHVATLFSVLIVFKKQVVMIVKNPFGILTRKLFIATVPTVVIILIFKNFFDKAFEGNFLPFCFMLTAVLIVVAEFVSIKKRKIDKDISYKSAFVMGITQGIAGLPGISRSGSTICTGLIMGENKQEVANFSFLMSVPIIFASLIYEIYNYVSIGQVVSIPWYQILISFMIAFFVGMLAIKFMLSIIKKKSFIVFSVYLAILSIVSFFVL